MCLCGENINLGQIPNPRQFRIITEPIFEQLVSELPSICQKNGPEQFKRLAYTVLNQQMRGILVAIECPRCDRLAVFTSTGSPVVDLSYQLEVAYNPDKGSSLLSLTNYMVDHPDVQESDN
jgi:hypothetical protein